MMTKRLYIDPDDEMREAFKVFDRDGDGYVASVIKLPHVEKSKFFLLLRMKCFVI